MGLQSTTFYAPVAWLPSIEMSLGRSEAQAGWDLFLFVGVGIFSSLLTPLLMRHTDDQRLAAFLASVLVLLGLAGLLILPNILLLWVIVAGLGAGSSLVTALTIIGMRVRTHRQATALSGMAQSVGYLLAASGPFMLGVLYDSSGSWQLPLVVLTAVAALQLIAGLAAGRRQYVS
jgi:CP family cyanate transporter-like MFS transporter